MDIQNIIRTILMLAALGGVFLIATRIVTKVSAKVPV